MRELDKTIAKIRLTLADIASREAGLESLRRQLHMQLGRLPRVAVYGTGDLDTVLTMVRDVETRLDEIEADLRRLGLLKGTAHEELETLELTKRIEDQREKLQSLRARAQESGAVDEKTLAEIRHLERSISEDSDLAAQRIMVHHVPPPGETH